MAQWLLPSEDGTKIDGAPDGSKTNIVTDASGNVVKVTGSNGVETTYKYDEKNKLVESTGPLGNLQAKC
jgi:YD repeat-containing protein